MLDDITFVSSALERDPAHLLEDSRGKGKGRAGAFMYKLQGETVEEERTVIKQYSKRTSTSHDCGQSSHPTTVTLSTKRKLTTTIKRKATIESLLNEPSKKPKRRDSTPVVSSQVKQPTEGTTKLFSTFAPVLDVQGNHPQKSYSDPQGCQRRTSRSISLRRFSSPAALAWHGKRLSLFLDLEKVERLDNDHSSVVHDGPLFQEPDGMDYEEGEHHSTGEQTKSKPVGYVTIEQDTTEEHMYEIERGSQLASSSEATPGRRRALVIAIQYRGQRWPDVNDKPGTKSMELKASHEDADDVRELLIDQGYCTQDIRLMTDRPGAPSGDIPTCENIARALGELVAWARPSDCLFLYFAGHGKQIFDKEYDEDDGLDETIIPYDWATRFNYDDRGLIVDDFLREAFINKLPEGCQLTAVFDSCHAGTILDLPEVYHVHQDQPQQDRPTNPIRYVHKKVAARVMCFAACMDFQRAFNTTCKSTCKPRGRFTKTFTRAMRKLKSKNGRNPTVQELFDFVVTKLPQTPKSPQNPLLTSSFEMLDHELRKIVSF